VRAFQAGAPRSHAGDALKLLDLGDRLFRNRCSYLIYSDAFAALPAELKARVFRGLFTALRGNDQAGRYLYLGADEKKRIYQILVETHADARQHLAQLAAGAPMPPATGSQ
jgi:hypothetical protein